MMELILNVAWLTIAVACYALLVQRMAKGDPEYACEPGRFRAVLALSCALLILFPVISLSDDLQEMQAAVVEPSPARFTMKRAGVNGPSNPEKNQHQLPFVISQFVIAIGWDSSGNLAARPIADSVASLVLAKLCRAPPFFTSSQTS
jgi:hypothetical protein